MLVLASPFLPGAANVFPFAAGLVIVIAAYRAGARASFVVYAASAFALAAIVLALQRSLESSLSAAFADVAWIMAACGLIAALIASRPRRHALHRVRSASARETVVWMLAAVAGPLLVLLPFLHWQIDDPVPSTIVPAALGIALAAIGVFRGVRAALVAYAASAWAAAALLLVAQGHLWSMPVAALADVAYVAAACAIAGALLSRRAGQPRDLERAR